MRIQHFNVNKYLPENTRVDQSNINTLTFYYNNQLYNSVEYIITYYPHLLIDLIRVYGLDPNLVNKNNESILHIILRSSNNIDDINVFMQIYHKKINYNIKDFLDCNIHELALMYMQYGTPIKKHMASIVLFYTKK